jgi:hypothetical protein
MHGKAMKWWAAISLLGVAGVLIVYFKFVQGSQAP